MGKVVILGGNARSGKSTLANMLTKHGFNKISFDNLYDAIEEGLNIKVDELSEDAQSAFFKSILNKSLEEAILEDVNTVIDMYDFLPKDIATLEAKEKYEVYFLAYPSCTLDEIKYNVVHYAKPTDWIAQVDEEYLETCAKRFYERNELLVSECQKYNMNLIDTKSGESRGKIINDLLNKIVE